MADYDVAVCADESGTHGPSDVSILAGYIAGIPSWRRFEREWEAVLERYDVLDFHSKDFFAMEPSGKRTGKYKLRSDSATKARYADWPLQQYVAFIEDLLGVIASSRLEPVGAMVETKDFFSYSYGERRYLTSAHLKESGKWKTSGAPTRPYHLLFDHLLADAARKTKPGKRVLFVFDKQEQYEARALQQFGESAAMFKEGVREKFGAIMFSDRHEAPGVQAADLYVYCWHRYATNPRSVVGLRRRALDVLTQKHRGLLHYTKEHMDGLFRNLPPDRRAQLLVEKDPSKPTRGADYSE